MPRDFRRGPTEEGTIERATTQVRDLRLEGRELDHDGHRFERYVAWLEQIAGSLSKAGATGHLMTCEQLIGDLRRLIRADRDPPLGRLQPEIMHCFGGLRSILRAMRARELPLESPLRRELVELVGDITQTVMELDLDSESD